ncbi:unnamed protein product [Ambrosiozyma monospora]|uniref:Unnamed protein product n=1 Tax=Ambrosiozyma monospora TaxID=43982 RepID=A0ACB5U542_AMBMO|nr:unnamed protein product [Ambrosiozyma monospora]
MEKMYNLALKRLKVGIPATIEHLNYVQKQSPAPSSSITTGTPPPSGSNEGGGNKGKLIAEATGSFITLMDAIKLNYNTKEQLHPLLTDIITLSNKIFPEFKGKANLVQWLIKLNGLKLGEFLDDDDLKEFLWDVEVGYKGFFSLLG